MHSNMIRQTWRSPAACNTHTQCQAGWECLPSHPERVHQMNAQRMDIQRVQMPQLCSRGSRGVVGIRCEIGQDVDGMRCYRKMFTMCLRSKFTLVSGRWIVPSGRALPRDLSAPHSVTRRGASLRIENCVFSVYFELPQKQKGVTGGHTTRPLRALAALCDVFDSSTTLSMRSVHRHSFHLHNLKSSQITRDTGTHTVRDHDLSSM